MTCLQWLQALASIASIITAFVAAWAYGKYLWGRRQKRLRLERHLKAQKASSKGGDQGQRSVADTMAFLGMTEADVLEAAFSSRHIKRSLGLGPTGMPPRMDLEYIEPNSN